MARHIPEATKQAMRGYLGVLPDAEIGKKFNVSAEYVGMLRRKHGISPAAQGRAKRERVCRGKVLPLLGKMTDADISRVCGVDPTTIRGIRDSNGKRRMDTWRC